MDPYALGTEGLVRLLAGEPGYRVSQVRSWLARGVDDPADMSDLPVALRRRLGSVFDPPPRLLGHRTADGGRTHKVLLEVAASGRPEAIESVLMLYPREAPRHGSSGRARSAARATVCVSTQAGCALGCPFCATGQAGFRRQLGVGEIVRQISVMQRLLVTREIAGPGVPDHVTNVVFMGMGEPLANLEPTVDAIRWLVDPQGLGLSARSVTVSTVGLVPGIRRLAELGLPITLAVSLHAPNDALRDDLVPVNRRWPLDQLIDACVAYQVSTGRRLTVEYVLIDGVNTSSAHARELADVVAALRRPGGPLPHVNLIPMNPTPSVRWRAPAPARQAAFADVVRRAGVPVTTRRNRGADIDAACGQLYAERATGSGRRLPAAVGAADRVAAAGDGPDRR